MRRTTIIIALLVVLSAPFLSAKDMPAFGKGVAYLLIGDKALATQQWDLFFESYPDPALRGPFMALIEASDLWEVTKQFKQYLDLHHRSTTALVGIALATSNMKQSTSIDNLIRATRMEPSFSSAYLCMGAEYLKMKNYPQAKFYFDKALAFLNLPEYKILLAKLYLQTNQPANALNLLKPVADKQPDNFYFNYLVAEAFLELNQFDDMYKYVQTAIELNPNSNEAQLLKARYFLKRNDANQALAVLKTLKYSDYDEDYYKTYGQVLLKLKNRKCKTYFDRIYWNNRWDKDINRLMGIFYDWKNQGDANVQNWINRSILAGNSPELLKSLFPGKYIIPTYSYLPFFEINVIRWISDEIMVVAAIKESGEEEKLFFINTLDMKVTNVLSYKGQLRDFFLSEDRKKIIFSTTAVENQSVYAYAVELSDSSPRLSVVSSRSLPMPSIDVGFNYSGSLAYITDSRLATLAFESPFSIVSEIGEKTPVYPSYPFPIYKFNFVTNQLEALDINDIKLVGNVPIENVKKYYMIYKTHESKSSVQELMQKGKQMDLTSSELVRIYFSSDLTSFIIYLSDLKNAFQALIYEYASNKLYRVDETMFIGAGNYAELNLMNFDPQRNEFQVLTKDNEKRLITFNYKSFLSLELASKVIESYLDNGQEKFYILTERSKKSIFTETNLEIVSLHPFLREIITNRRDLDHFLFTREHDQVYFTTFNGELLMMDGENQFHYVGPSVDGSLNSLSPSYKKRSAFINGRLYILDSLYKGSLIKKESKGE